MNPNISFHSNEKQPKFNLNFFDYFDEYSKYLNRLLNEYLTDNIYDDFTSKITSLSLSEQIKDFFKLISQRYRIIVQVFIQQHLDQSILIASRSLWDKTRDTFIQTNLKKTNISLLVIVFFIYKE
jgi:hypothetical protein